MEDLNKWIKAGKIASEVREYARSIVKKDMLLLELAEKIEAKIVELGGEIAFPVNLSSNDVAAHYTPVHDDKIVLKEQLLKVDIGVHVDGCIGDTAFTADLSGQNSELVKASHNALMAAIEIVKEKKAEAALGEIGRAIHKEITEFGFSPVKNLSGHGLQPYGLHTKPSIPNYDTGDVTKLGEDITFAIEPFASAGQGMIYESSNPVIFSQEGTAGIRNPISKSVFIELKKYNSLPFASRWLCKKFSDAKVGYALRDLERIGILKSYPPLPDKSHGLVSQAEHSLYVGKDKVIVLTE